MIFGHEDLGKKMVTQIASAIYLLCPGFWTTTDPNKMIVSLI